LAGSPSGCFNTSDAALREEAKAVGVTRKLPKRFPCGSLHFSLARRCASRLSGFVVLLTSCNQAVQQQIEKTMTNKTETGTAPDFIAYQVRQGQKKAYWTRIGAAWVHQDTNGFNIQLDAVPLDGKIVLRSAPEKQD
jgi:hypothetical protein